MICIHDVKHKPVKLVRGTTIHVSLPQNTQRERRDYMGAKGPSGRGSQNSWPQEDSARQSPGLLALLHCIDLA